MQHGSYCIDGWALGRGWIEGVGRAPFSQFCSGDERLANSSADLAPGTTMSVKVGSGAATCRKSSRGFRGDSPHFQNIVPARQERIKSASVLFYNFFYNFGRYLTSIAMSPGSH